MIIFAVIIKTQKMQCSKRLVRKGASEPMLEVLLFCAKIAQYRVLLCYSKVNSISKKVSKL